MAAISKRGNKWFAQIRKKGFVPRYQTFESKLEAESWARKEEGLIDLGFGIESNTGHRYQTLRAVLERYKVEVSTKKRGAKSEILRLSKMQRSPMCDLPIVKLTPAAIADYRDHRLQQVKAGTVKRELGILRHAIEMARKQWAIPIQVNPVSQIDLPKVNDTRDRRLKNGELERLLVALKSTRNSEIELIVLVAIETAMRLSEICNLNWHDIDLQRQTANIAQSKSGVPRKIPLSQSALQIFSNIDRTDDCQRVFSTSPNAVKQCWKRIRVRAGCLDLRFHDLRHEAISRFCEMGLSIPEVASISGHSDPRMLFRYVHLDPSKLAQKINHRRTK